MGSKPHCVQYVLTLFLAIFSFPELYGQMPGQDVGPGTSANVPGSAVSFRNDVFPIIQQKCNAGECHGYSGKAFPKYHSFLMIRAKSKKMMKRILNQREPMPPPEATETLTPEEIATIQAWIDAGTPEN